MKIEFEFTGGPFDGRVVCSDGEGTGDTEAHGYWLMTSEGQIGKRFWTASEYAIETIKSEPAGAEQRQTFPGHKYEVTDRQETEDGCRVKVEYVGTTE